MKLPARRNWLFIIAMVLATSSVAEPVTVETSPLQDLQFHPRHSAPASVISLNDARLSAQINARVESIEVQEGQQLEPGTTLIRLDCRDNEQLLKQAQAQWQFARDQFNRIKRLRANKNASEEDYSRRLFERTQAEVAQAQARLQVERCTIKAPFKGVVLEKMVSTGDLAAPGTQMIRILDTDAIEIKSSVPYSLVGSLTEAKERFFEQRGKRYPVELLRVTAYIDTISNDQMAYLRFTDTPPLIGAAGRLSWTEPNPYLPSRYVVERNGTLGLFVMDNDQAKFVVLPGALEGLATPIDLPPDQQVITSGLAGMRDGAPITAAP